MENKRNNIIRIIAFAVSAVLLLSSGITYTVRKTSEPPVSEQLIAPEAEADPVLSKLKASYGGTEYPDGIRDKFKNAYAMNNDLVGWLKIPGTKVDTPILQSDSNTHYLRNNYYGIYTNYGDPFMDFRNKTDELSRNTILYGHNLIGDPVNNGMVFSDVMKYRNLDGYKNAPIIEFSTLYKDYKFKVFAAFVTNAEDSDDNGYTFYYIEPEMNDNQFMEFTEQILMRSIYSTDVEIKQDDKILMLSTCTYELDKGLHKVSGRLVVTARLVREGESEEVDVSKAKLNENPRFPQAYYDKHGINNPYKNSEKWVIS